MIYFNHTQFVGALVATHERERSVQRTGYEINRERRPYLRERSIPGFWRTETTFLFIRQNTTDDRIRRELETTTKEIYRITCTL